MVGLIVSSEIRTSAYLRSSLNHNGTAILRAVGGRDCVAGIPFCFIPYFNCSYVAQVVEIMEIIHG